MSSDLEKLLSGHRHVWRGRGAMTSRGRVLATGFTVLDAVLPEGGWPADALMEVIAPREGIGELQLLLPAMVTAARQGQWLVWIAPPYIPCASALVASGISLQRLLLLRPSRQEDIPWAMEKVLRQRRCAMVLAWPGRLKPVVVRRLQLAAAAGQSLGVLFQHRDGSGSPAALRLRLAAAAAGLQVDILKSRGACRRQSIHLTFA